MRKKNYKPKRKNMPHHDMMTTKSPIRNQGFSLFLLNISLHIISRANSAICSASAAETRSEGRTLNSAFITGSRGCKDLCRYFLNL